MNRPPTKPTTKKYWYAVINENTAEANSETVPVIPANCLKYFLPNKPSKRKLANGQRRINRQCNGFKVTRFFKASIHQHLQHQWNYMNDKDG